MTSRIVTTQTELDAALTDAVDRIIIDSPSGVWLRVTETGSSHVVARGSSYVVAWGSSRVAARDSSHIAARDSSHVEARGSSRVAARGSSYVEAWDSSYVAARDSSRVKARGSSYVVAWGSSRVAARDSSRVEAWGSSYVVAWGSPRVAARDSSHVEARDSSYVAARDSSYVEAWDSSYVEAWDSSRVAARDSSRVDARGSSSVEARGSSRVEAGRYVAVHLHSASATVTGGVVIDIAGLDMSDPTIWCDYHGVKVTGAAAVVYKAVSPELTAGQGRIPTTYTIGETVTATDWKPTTECGNGLHFGDTPRRALYHYQGDDRSTARFLACEITVAGSVPLGEKIKAPSCNVLHEVNLDGEVIA